MSPQLRTLGGRLLGTLGIVAIVVVGFVLGALGASLLAGIALGTDDADAVTAWVNERVFIPTTIGWLVAMPGLVLLGRKALGLTADVLGLRPREGRRPRFVLGFALGLLLILLPAGLARLFGGFVPMDAAAVDALAVPTGAAAISGIVYILPALLVAALGEELLFRGVLLRWWEPVLGVKGALVLSALLFVAVHVGNPGASPLGSIGVLLAGVLLGLVFVLHGDLWLVAGLHLGWNVSEALVLGVPVSGHTLPALLRWTVADSELARGLLGGSFGPEEGLLFHGALAVAIVLAVLSRPGSEDPGAPPVSPVDAAPAGS